MKRRRNSYTLRKFHPQPMSNRTAHPYYTLGCAIQFGWIPLNVTSAFTICIPVNMLHFSNFFPVSRYVDPYGSQISGACFVKLEPYIYIFKTALWSCNVSLDKSMSDVFLLSEVIRTDLASQFHSQTVRKKSWW